eukprot:CAMPEP_0177760472 /NCGR_PEP_ID=MMETSP0491_2-20121128/5285_1 /TAXON_ID=63592 /ORGANISM="Tetraselmis chuii, Strain PLY429" /LENGTH=289 /DNA_ID=CAMNT_0019276373 /DNA_START=276 /DNA_END=1145 /DNA_ORIENTATION=+
MEMQPPTDQSPLWQSPPPAYATGGPAAFLAPVPAVMVRQKLQIFEQFCPACEKQNFYRVGVVGPESVADPPDGEVFNRMNPHFVAQEDSTCMCRFWCGNLREFDLRLHQAAGPDQAGAQLLRMHRPFRCTLCCCCCMANPQEMAVVSNEGMLLGKVVQDWSCGRFCELFCCPGGYSYYAIKGPGGDTQFYIRHKFPTICNGCVNCCAPTCCNKSFDIDILDADGRTVLSMMKNVFPGFNCRCLADSSNLLMEFPAKATPEQRAVLLGGLFLVEYIHFEKQRDRDSGGDS